RSRAGARWRVARGRRGGAVVALSPGPHRELASTTGFPRFILACSWLSRRFTNTTPWAWPDEFSYRHGFGRQGPRVATRRSGGPVRRSGGLSRSLVRDWPRVVVVLLAVDQAEATAPQDRTHVARMWCVVIAVTVVASAASGDPVRRTRVAGRASAP